MEPFLEDVQSLSWWIGVVVVGVVVGVIATYLRDGMEWLGGRAFRRWSVRTAARTAARAELLAQLRASPHEQVMMGLDALDDRIHSVFHMTLGLACIAAGLILGGWLTAIGVVGFVGGVLTGVRSLGKQMLLREARRP